MARVIDDFYLLRQDQMITDMAKCIREWQKYVKKHKKQLQEFWTFEDKEKMGRFPDSITSIINYFERNAHTTITKRLNKASK